MLATLRVLAVACVLIALAPLAAAEDSNESTDSIPSCDVVLGGILFVGWLLGSGCVVASYGTCLVFGGDSAFCKVLRHNCDRESCGDGILPI